MKIGDFVDLVKRTIEIGSQHICKTTSIFKEISMKYFKTRANNMPGLNFNNFSLTFLQGLLIRDQSRAPHVHLNSNKNPNNNNKSKLYLYLP